MSRPPLLLLHGALASAAQFDSLIPHLGSDVALATLDFEGHGSRPCQGSFGPERFMANVLEDMDQRGWAQVDLFGYSLGGYVAVMLAKYHPQRVRRVHTLATKYIWREDSALRETRFLDPDKLMAKVPAFAQQLDQTHSALGWRGILEATSAMMLALAHQAPLADGLEEIQHPLMLSVGDADTTAGVEDTVSTWRRFPCARLQVIPGLAHPWEKADPAQIAATMAAFFRT